MARINIKSKTWGKMSADKIFAVCIKLIFYEKSFSILTIRTGSDQVMLFSVSDNYLPVNVTILQLTVKRG